MTNIHSTPRNINIIIHAKLMTTIAFHYDRPKDNIRGFNHESDDTFVVISTNISTNISTIYTVFVSIKWLQIALYLHNNSKYYCTTEPARDIYGKQIVISMKHTSLLQENPHTHWSTLEKKGFKKLTSHISCVKNNFNDIILDLRLIYINVYKLIRNTKMIIVSKTRIINLCLHSAISKIVADRRRNGTTPLRVNEKLAVSQQQRKPHCYDG